MDSSKIIDVAADIFIRNAITNAADSTLKKLLDLLNIDDGGYCPGTALHLDEHLNALVKDYCDIFSDQRMNARTN